MRGSRYRTLAARPGEAPVSAADAPPPVVIDGGDRACVALLLELRSRIAQLSPGTVIHLNHSANPAYALRASADHRQTEPHSPWRLTRQRSGAAGTVAAGRSQIGMSTSGTAGFRFVALGGLAAMLLGCGGYQPSGQVSGIEGHTMVGPSCSLMREASPCPDKPAAGSAHSRRAGSTVPLATAVGDARGYFRIPLPPGRYTVQPGNLRGAVVPIAQPVMVTVVSGRFTAVTIPFDSGIR
jgi:hypothetical protein